MAFQTGVANISAINKAWLNVITVPPTTSYNYNLSNAGQIFLRSNNGAGMTDGLIIDASIPNGWYMKIFNTDASAPILFAISNYTIDGLASILVQSGETLELLSDGTEFYGSIQASVGPGGSVIGEPPTTVNALVRWDSVIADYIKNSVALLSDAGALSGLTQLDVDNLELDGNTVSSTNTNGNLILSPNGTGIIDATKSILSEVSVQFKQTTAGANAVTVKSPASVTSYSFTLPNAVAGASSFLTTDTSGNLSYTATSTIGNVHGTPPSVANTIPTYTDTTGLLIGDTGVTIDGSNNMVVPGSITTNTSLLLKQSGIGANFITMQAPVSVTSYSLTWPNAVPGSSSFLTVSNTGAITYTAATGLGNVVGTPPSTATAIARYTDTSGLLIENSAVLISNTGTVNLTGDAIIQFGSTNVLKTIVLDENVALGEGALVNPTASVATSNTAIGYFALHGNTSGATNTAVGSGALAANNTGSSNTAVGVNAMSLSQTGFQNTSIGYGSLFFNLSGANNAALGNNALNNNITGSDNCAFGAGALQGTTVDDNSAFGYFALANNNAGIQNCAFGKNALGANVNTSQSCAFGWNALTSSTVAGQAAFGHRALEALTTGTGCSAFGFAALRTNQTGNNSSAFGSNSATVATGANNSSFGASTLANTTTGTGLCAFGAAALLTNNSGSQNSAFGYQALQSNTSGNNSSAFGYQALIGNQTGVNSAFGAAALLNVISGTLNTAMGQNALFNTTGSRNTGVGDSAGASVVSGTGNTLVGNAADVSSGTDGFSIVLGFGALSHGSNMLSLGASTGGQGMTIAGSSSGASGSFLECYINGTHYKIPLNNP